MLTLALIAAAVIVGAAVRAGEFRSLDTPAAEVVADSWVVVMKGEADNFHTQSTEVATLGSRMGAHDMVVIGDFTALFVKGKDQAAMAEFVSHDAVKYIEPEVLMHVVGGGEACGETASPAGSWGLARVVADSAEEVDDFHFNASDGEGVTAFILDTGIQVEHTDFGGRAVWGGNFAGDGEVDGHGHGTHVASTVGGDAYGFAKKAKLVALAVCTPRGSCPSTAILNGIKYAAENGKGIPSTANMSLGGPRNSASNDAVDAAVKEGVVFVVAAGNENTDACTRSPASAESAITVGATDLGNSGGKQIDIRSYFSNYGKCAQVYAPGSDITAAWIGSSNEAVRAVSGTSMASPHVCGMTAVYLGQNPSATPAEVEQWVVSTGQKDMVELNCNNDACRDSNNVLLHRDCDAAKPTQRQSRLRL